MITIPRKKIREFDAKRLLQANLNRYANPHPIQLSLECALATPETDLEALPPQYAWLTAKKLVVKPDQLFTRKGKNSLVLLNAGWEEAKKFIRENQGKEIAMGNAKGELTHFLIEPFIEHEDEYFLAIVSQREEDVILFSEKGGVDVEEHWNKVIQIPVPIGTPIEQVEIASQLNGVPPEKKARLAAFIKALYRYYADFDYVYMEMNPLAFDKQGNVVPLGFVAELDDCAAFKNEAKWADTAFPQPFGRTPYPEEKFVKELDAQTGASLKLTILNPNGRIWLLVAGGGASVIYTDTVVDLGYGLELANYGEYSGDPNEEETYQYAKTIIDLATRNPKQETGNRILLIGGGVANFTDVANTFKGIIRALREYREKLQKTHMRIFVRRGGPNYQEGLENMRALGKELGIPIEVYGPETHMTNIVSLAVRQLGEKK
ncbi:MAG TPA: ATP citrate lyase citrate-binding domain-containing protein [Candidatus Bilamarchaeaceae archaeon]|nr:ATP citrate lyase citrate-binding domain-containing protein [Candidatus Bilamarchaeaceae archaeon]